jgi:hypothetical protein
MVRPGVTAVSNFIINNLHNPAMSMDESSNKRRRTDEDGSPSITRSELWLSDGNLVIQADSTQFRVHRSVLSMHSNILKDCFGIPQPEEQETVEGCPVVRMSDFAADIECVFTLLYKNHQCPIFLLFSFFHLECDMSLSCLGSTAPKNPSELRK